MTTAPAIIICSIILERGHHCRNCLPQHHRHTTIFEELDIFHSTKNNCILTFIPYKSRVMISLIKQYCLKEGQDDKIPQQRFVLSCLSRGQGVESLSASRLLGLGKECDLRPFKATPLASTSPWSTNR